jgi:hypothetical protein
MVALYIFVMGELWSVCSLSEDCIPYNDDGVGTVHLE